MKKYRISSTFLMLPLICGLCAFAAYSQEQPDLLQLRAELMDLPVLEGDPLRVGIYLTSPAQNSEIARGLKQMELGQSNITPVTITFNVSNRWPTGLVFDLYQVQTNGTRQPLMQPQQWPAFMVPAVEDDSRRLVLHRYREWLVPPGLLNLQPGSYALQVSWNSTGLVTSASTPYPDGLLNAQELFFDVQVVTNDLQRGQHAEHLAAFHYASGQFAEARTHALAAREFYRAVSNYNTIAMSTLAANASVALKQYRSAAQILSAEPGRDLADEASYAARRYLGMLLPEVAWLRATNTLPGLRLNAFVLPGGTYHLQSSTNLLSWQTMDIRTSASARYEIPESPESAMHRRFYRILWAQ